MNIQEYLFVCLAEELSEIAQESSKCLRFTPNHTPLGIYETSNLERLQLEFADACAVSSLLRMRCNIETGMFLSKYPSEAVVARYNEKLVRTVDLIKVSIDLGALNDSDN